MGINMSIYSSFPGVRALIAVMALWLSCTAPATYAEEPTRSDRIVQRYQLIVPPLYGAKDNSQAVFFSKAGEVRYVRRYTKVYEFEAEDEFEEPTTETNNFEEIAPVQEAGELPKGSYAVVAAQYPNNDLRIFRIHQQSGATYYAEGSVYGTDEFIKRSHHWIPFTAEKGEADVAAAPGGDVAGERYDLSVAQSNQDIILFRCANKSGRVWQLGKDPFWSAYIDDKKLPVGDYAMIVGKANDGDFAYARIDRATGNCWSPGPKRSWDMLKESTKNSAKPAAKDGESPYQIVFFPVDKVCLVFRFHTRTGQTWGEGGDGWSDVVAEPAAIPESSYAWCGVSAAKQGVLLARIDRTSGATWLRGATPWRAMKESDDSFKPGKAKGDPCFELIGAGDKSSQRFVRYHDQSGATWITDDHFVWNRVADDSKLPKSRYECRLVQSGEHTFHLTRLDRDSGRWWVDENGVWKDLKPAAQTADKIRADKPPRYEQRLVATKSSCQAALNDTWFGHVTVYTPQRGVESVINERNNRLGGWYQIEQTVKEGERIGETVDIVQVDLDGGGVASISRNQFREDQQWGTYWYKIEGIR